MIDRASEARQPRRASILISSLSRGHSAACSICSNLLAQDMSLQLNKYEFSLLFLLALIPQVIGHSLLNWALGVMPAYFVAITLLGEPIGSTILAFIFLKEIPNKNEIIGAGIILLGILIAILGSSSESEYIDDSLTD